MELCLIGNTNAGSNLSNTGAHAARKMLLNIEFLVKSGTDANGDFDIHAITKLLTACLVGTGEYQRGVLLAIADYIASAIDGCPPDLWSWNPMERTLPRLV